MKKIIIMLLAVLAFGSAEAQFKVQETHTAPEVVWQNGFNHLKLCKTKGSGSPYYYISILSTNQFDDRIILHLGGLGKAKATLNQILNELFKEGEIYQLVDDRGEAFTGKCNPLGDFTIFKEGYAGAGHIMLYQFRKMQAALEQE